MTGAPTPAVSPASPAERGTVTDRPRTVAVAAASGAVLGLLGAWVLVPFAGLERLIATVLGGVGGLVIAALALVLMSYARQLIDHLRGGRVRNAADT